LREKTNQNPRLEARILNRLTGQVVSEHTGRR
jgi:hypothetical protein